MKIIVSRRFRLPRTVVGLSDAFYFNLWQRRHWPYDALRNDATLFLYESSTQLFVWKARARDVRSMEYASRAEAYDWLLENYGNFDHHQPYLERPPERGYCLAFACEPLKLLDVPKPKGNRIPMLGWVRDAEFIKACGL